MRRRLTRLILVGNVPVGGGAPVSIQSMTNTDTRDVSGTVNQILQLEDTGCDIVRVAVPDKEAALALKNITRAVSAPVVADIHFDYRLALLAIENGAGGLRINPGNIGSREKVGRVVRAAKKQHIPIRIGVNGGSLEKELLKKHGSATPQALVESALNQLRFIEEEGYENLKISLKSSSVLTTVRANRLLAEKTDYPIHLGITEAGIGRNAVIKSALGIGILLEEGIGDTIRVSLTGDPLEEVKVAREILSNLELAESGPQLVSCPTCARCEIPVEQMAEEVEKILQSTRHNLQVAVMGCVVNGPGEAREADLGIAGGKELGLLFRKGRVIRKVPRENLLEEFENELKKLIEEKNQEV